MNSRGSSAVMSDTTNTKSMSPSQRPSYFDFSSTSGLYPPQNDFDEGVIKQLDLDIPDESISASTFSEDTSVIEDEKLKTFLRIRPMSYIKEGFPVLEIKDEQTVIANNSRRKVLFGGSHEGLPKQTEFKFSKILGPDCGQSTVFEECVNPMIQKFMRHENCLIFSYGATNSGKTYTMQGHGTEYGIIPRTLDAIFSQIHDRQYKLGNIRPHLYQGFQHLNQPDVDLLCDKREKIIAEANVKHELMRSYRLTGTFSDRSGSTVEILSAGQYDNSQTAIFSSSTLYSVWVSYAELYNERVYDLLETSATGKNRRRKELKLMQDRNGCVYIKDLTEVPVTSDEEAYKIFLAGRKNLQFAATQMNQNSSRSHSFFTIRVVSIGVGDGMIPYPKTVHRMTFCDLAGMERANQTENKGYRLQESGNINNSLTVLLKVIRVLREKQVNNNRPVMIETVPFRESKLTHIFKSYFTSATHICMVVNVSPDPMVAESTLHVLQNSAVASNVVVFRSLENNVQAMPFVSPSGNKIIGKPPIPPYTPRSRTCSSRSTTQTEDSDSSDHDSDNQVFQTVIAPRTLLQKLKILEDENERLRRALKKSEEDKSKIREEALKLFMEQKSQWMTRMQESKVMEENFNLRRLSLLKNQLSPASRCGRCRPPTADMEDIDETAEEFEESENETEEEEDEDEAEEEYDSDKEN